ncbi:hypothetical protein EC915_108130 [Pseudomonas sp. LP_7_YM]|nr:hypothetical protein EC915_108130 [Pseudomonas sp. LP_7_YM]
MNRSHENNMQVALKACRGSFLSVGFFSLFVNTLMLVPTFYMIQVSGWVVPRSSTSTLIMLTLILTILMLTLGSLEWVRSRIMVRISNRLDVLLSRDVYRASFRKALNSGGMDALTLTNKIDDPAMIKFTAYDYTIYGGLKGKLEQIGANTIPGRRKEEHLLRDQTAHRTQSPGCR